SKSIPNRRPWEPPTAVFYSPHPERNGPSRPRNSALASSTPAASTLNLTSSPSIDTILTRAWAGKASSSPTRPVTSIEDPPIRRERGPGDELRRVILGPVAGETSVAGSFINAIQV